MGQVLNFPGIAVLPTCAMPTIFTPQLVARIAQVNQTARTLRSLGYRIVDEDVSPNDGGSPIIQIDLNGLSTRAVFHLASCSVRDTRSGVERATIEGVRVFWSQTTPASQGNFLETN